MTRCGRWLFLAAVLAALATQRALPQAAGAVLWRLADGSPLTEIALHFRIREHTRAAFGRAVDPHLFRDYAATSLALEDSAPVRLAAQLPGHGSFRTTERHHNLARGQEAAARWHQTLDGLRRRGVPKRPARG